MTGRDRLAHRGELIHLGQAAVDVELFHGRKGIGQIDRVAERPHPLGGVTQENPFHQHQIGDRPSKADNVGQVANAARGVAVVVEGDGGPHQRLQARPDRGGQSGSGADAAQLHHRLQRLLVEAELGVDHGQVVPGVGGGQIELIHAAQRALALDQVGHGQAQRSLLVRDEPRHGVKLADQSR